MRHFESLVEMFFDNALRGRDRIVFRFKEGKTWHGISWREAAQNVSCMAAFLREELSLPKGARIAIMAENNPRWAMADLAIMSAGGVTVPLYVAQSQEDNAYCLEFADVEIVFATTRTAKMLGEISKRSNSMIRAVIMMDEGMGSFGKGVSLFSWRKIVAQGGTGLPPSQVSSLGRESLSSIIYTSGTSARPKGVMLSHGAILSNCEGAAHLLRRIGLRGNRFLSFLPLAHSFERTCVQFFPLTLGDAEIAYAESLERLIQNMQETKPTLVAGVPRLYQTMAQRLMTQMTQATGIKGILMHHAHQWGVRRLQGGLPLWLLPLDALVDMLVRRKVRARFGGNVKAFIAGGAALPREVNETLEAFGLRLLQGYGQTESAPIISCNAPEDNVFGTVGHPFKNVQLRISNEGELCVRGENVMQGYWKNDKATQEALRDGWLHTGDIASVNKEGYITITDRLKDMIVNSGGDNIAPQKIEDMLCAQEEIAQAAVFGDGKPYLVAVVVMEKNVKTPLEDVLARVNKKLSPIEQIKRAIVAEESFTTDNHLMTPTLKIRRRAIGAHYEDKLANLYGRVN